MDLHLRNKNKKRQCLVTGLLAKKSGQSTQRLPCLISRRSGLWRTQVCWPQYLSNCNSFITVRTGSLLFHFGFGVWLFGFLVGFFFSSLFLAWVLITPNYYLKYMTKKIRIAWSSLNILKDRRRTFLALVGLGPLHPITDRTWLITINTDFHEVAFFGK